MEQSGHPPGGEENNHQDWEKMGARPKEKDPRLLLGSVYEQTEGILCGAVCEQIETPGLYVVEGIKLSFFKKHSTDADLICSSPETMSLIPSLCHEPNGSFRSTSVPNGEHVIVEGSRKRNRESNSPGRDSLEATDNSRLALVERALRESEEREQASRDAGACANEETKASHVCLDKRLQGKHKCRPHSGHDECCICLEDAFSGCQILPCSHCIKREAMVWGIIPISTRCFQRLFGSPEL